MEKKSIEQRIAAIEDKMAIKYVVDEFSNLADTKEIDKQVLLFTEDGTVSSISSGQPSAPLKGREQLKQALMHTANLPSALICCVTSARTVGGSKIDKYFFVIG